MATELATAYFSFLPSMAGTAAAAAPGFLALEGQAAASGARSGALMGGALAGGLGKFIPIVGGILAGVGVANLFSDAVGAASDLNESANAVKVTFGDAADEIAKLGETSAERLGLSQVNFNALTVRFAAFAEKIAGEGGNVISVIDELTTRGADFASVYNLEVNEALTLFQSGLAGETEPLRRFGLDVSAAAVEAYAYANGIAAVGEELTEAEKIQARYGLIMEQTSKTQGDFANTSDELANQQRIVSAELEDNLAALGEALLPAAEKFTEFMLEEGIPLLNKLIPLFEKMEPLITGGADALIGFLGTAVDNIDSWLTFIDAIDDGKLSIEELREVLFTMPDFLANGIVGAANFAREITNFFIDGINAVGNAIEAIVNSAEFFTNATIDIRDIPNLPPFSLNPLGGARNATGGRPPAAMASGGEVGEPGWSWVGEHGPEMLWMPQGAEVHPLDTKASGFPRSVKLVVGRREFDAYVDEFVRGYDSAEASAQDAGWRND